MEAILREGTIVPLEPFPAEWTEGVRLNVAIVDEPLDIDGWAKSMNELCAASSVDDESVMREAIAQHRQESKRQMRREMGLPE